MKTRLLDVERLSQICKIKNKGILRAIDDQLVVALSDDRMFASVMQDAIQAAINWGFMVNTNATEFSDRESEIEEIDQKEMQAKLSRAFRRTDPRHSGRYQTLLEQDNQTLKIDRIAFDIGCEPHPFQPGTRMVNLHEGGVQARVADFGANSGSLREDDVACHFIFNQYEGNLHIGFQVPIFLIVRGFWNPDQGGKNYVYSHLFQTSDEIMAGPNELALGNSAEGRALYIGITNQSWAARWQQHLNDARRGSNTIFHGRSDDSTRCKAPTMIQARATPRC